MTRLLPLAALLAPLALGCAVEEVASPEEETTTAALSATVEGIATADRPATVNVAAPAIATAAATGPSRPDVPTARDPEPQPWNDPLHRNVR